MVNLLDFMNVLILWRLGKNYRAGEDFVGMTLRSACKWRVKEPAFCIIYTEEQFAAILSK